MKINGNLKLFASAHFDAAKYIASPSYGVNRFMLDRIGEEKARATTIVEYKPNSKFPPHTHIGGEEFIVLEGTFRDEFGDFPEGTYVRNPIGSEHAPWVEEDGCTIYVKLLQMADTGEGTDPLHVSLDQSAGTSHSYGTHLHLYSNKETGEEVGIYWLEANEPIPHTQGLDGEELLVIKGSVKYESEIFEKWGWLRFPPVSSRSPVVAGPNGAQIFCKSNHLSEKALAMEKIQIADNGTYVVT